MFVWLQATRQRLNLITGFCRVLFEDLRRTAETFLGYSVDMLPPPRNLDVQLRGLSPHQKSSCRDSLDAFLNRHALAYWGLIVDLTESSQRTWQLEVTAVAPIELDFPVRTTHLKVDKMVNLARVVDLCLETHFHACMNR